MTVCFLLALVPVYAADDSQNEEGWWQRQFRQFHSYGHLDRAYRLMNEGRLAEAHQQFRHYLSLAPGDKNALVSYVNLSYQLKDYGEVVRVTSQLLDDAPDLDPMRLLRALARQQIDQLDGAFEDALIVGNSATADEADRRLALDTAAHIAVQRDQLTVAQDTLDLLLLRQPSHDVQVRRALVLQKLDRLPEAEDAYREALTLADNPAQRIDGHIALGSLLARQQKWEDAERHFMLAYELAPRNPDLLLQLAETAWAEQDFAQVKHWARERLAVSANRRAQELLAYVLYESGDYGGAVAELQQLEATASSDSERQSYATLLADSFYASGDYPSAIRWARASIGVDPSPRANEILALAYFDNKEYPQAIRSFESLLPQLRAPEKLLQTHMYLGYAHMGNARYEEAARAFGNAAHYDPTPTARLAQAEALSALGDRAALIEVYEELQTRGDLPSATRDELSTRIGYLYSQLNDYPAAIATFRRVVSHRGTDWRTRLALAITLYESAKITEALASFLSVIEDTESAEALFYAGLCYKKMEKPGLAIHYLDMARALSAQLSDAGIMVLQEELGYLHANEGNYEQSAYFWRSALALEYSPTRILMLAQAERLTGNANEAITLLTTLDQSSDNTTERAPRLTELAYAYAAEKRYAEAIMALTRAIDLAPSHDKYYQLANYHRHVGDLAKAASALQVALAGQPLNTEYAVAMGYLALEDKRYDQAAPLFEAALAREPDYIALHRELGYIYMHRGDNDQASAHFRRAIDAAQLETLPPSAVAQNQRDQELYRLRTELSKLNNRIDVEAYHIFRQETDTAPPESRLLGIGYAPSQGGIDIAYQPARIGLRDEKMFQIFGRLLWQSETDSQKIDSESLQGALGARYKPLRLHNLHLSAERRIGIGADSRTDWLVRAQYSHSAGWVLPPGTHRASYRSVYADGAYVLTGTPLASYYGELRQGITLALSDAFMLSPYALLDFYGQTVDSSDDYAIEAGVGVSLRGLFGGSRYAAATSQVEVNAQYKANFTEDQSGLTASVALRF